MKVKFTTYRLRIPAPIAIFLIIFLSFSDSSNCQTIELDSQYMYFENLGVKDGLHAGYINKLLIDKDGYLWFTTSQGLQKYDGNNITNFTHNTEDKYSAPSSDFSEFYEDNFGNLWLSNDKDQVYMFEKSTERFFEFDLEISKIRLVDEENRIWFVNKNFELCYFHIGNLPKDIHFFDREWCNKHMQVIAPKGLKIHPVHTEIKFHPNGELWIVNDYEFHTYSIDFANNTLNEKNKFKLDKEGYDKKPHWQPKLFVHDKTLESYLFFKDSYCKLDSLTGQIEKCYQLPIRDYFPRPQLIDSQGKLWISCHEDIMFTLDLENNKLTKLKRDKRNLTYTSNSIGSRIAMDENHNIWIPTTGYGINMYASNKNRFSYFGEDHKGPAIAKFKSLGNSAFLQADGYLGFFDLENNKFVNLHDLGIDFSYYNKHRIFDVSQDSLLNMTIELPFINLKTKRQTVTLNDNYLCNEYKINRKGELIIPIKTKDCKTYNQHQIKPIEHHESWSYYEDWTKDYFLQIKHINNNISSTIDSTTTSSVYDTTLNVYNSHRKSNLFCENDFWFGYRDGGLLRFDLNARSWTHYAYDQNDSLSLSSDVVYQMMEDPYYPDSLLWIATNNGINILDIRTHQIRHIKQEDGMPNNVINIMLTDKRKNIWASTNNGLVHIDYKTKRISSFSSTDGLQHDEFNVQAGAKTDNGYLYFGGMGGLTYFDPEIFYQDSLKSKVILSDFKVFNKSTPYSRISVDNDDLIHLKKPIHQSQTINIPYNQKMISFSFSVLDLTDPSKNEYKYMLNGFNDTWISLGSKNEATFTNLQPGLHTLRVQGKNYIGVWSDINNLIKIRVLAPWWMTWWFRILALVLLLGITYAFFRYRTKQKEKMQALKNRISKDLHDEIGSTLSSISLYSLVAEKKIGPGQKEIGNILSKINETSTSVMESINDIVWTIGSGSENIKEIINRLRAFTSDLVQDDQQIVYEIQPKLLEKEVEIIVKRNIYLILKEAINNANKYANASLIKIEMNEKNGQIFLSITDNGIGFDLDLENIQNKPTLGGNGLRNIESRVKEIGGKLRIVTKQNEGTKIEITFKLTK